MGFQTLDGIEVPSLTADQMRAVDDIAIENSKPALLQMMEYAGASLAEFAIEQWPRAARVGPVVVLAGTGHNGGGGICAAYHLLSQGVPVRLCLSDSEAKLKGTTAVQFQRYRNAGGITESPITIWEPAPMLIIDALLGYGVTGTARGPVLTLIERANAIAKGHGSALLSLDLPSGVNPDNLCNSCTGSIRADKTLTLASPKPGLG
ncbi:MAG: NAD(P)H-hydrate epimerase, partial [Mariprofundaceae bacterium]|nr:NAD(P)H-hydrate epimerase [Mariprofundaceae bacterium]